MRSMSWSTVLLGGLGLVAALASTNGFTPQDMLSTPRPQPAIASPDGSHAVSLVDQWDPRGDRTIRAMYLLSVNNTVYTPPLPLFTCAPSEASDVLWLSDDTVAYLNVSSLCSIPINYTTALDDAIERTHLFDFPQGISPTGLKYESTSGVLAFSGMVWGDRDFESVAKHDDLYEVRGTSGVVYDELFIRHWDTWRTSEKYWTLGLTKLDKHQSYRQSLLHDRIFLNVLNGTGLSSQMDPIDDFTLSSSHLAFAVKPPRCNQAAHTREDVYVLPLPSSHAPSYAPNPLHLTLSIHGAVSSLAFSPDGKKLAWLEMAEDGYESDKRVLKVHTLAKHGVGETHSWTSEWDRSPSSIEWAPDSKSIFLIAEHEGKVLPYHISHADHLPTPLHFSGSTSVITALTESTLLLSKSSLTSPTDSFILNLSDDTDGEGDKLPRDPLHRLTDWSSKHIDGRLQGMTGEGFWFSGAEDWEVMGWAVKPKGWKKEDAEKGKRYPMAFFIHGGPQGAWEDAWSTRWNPALFAAQGYFVIAINPTGSTGYGQEFTDRIQKEWGGRPFKDLIAGYHAALDRYPEIDPNRTAALGASYGGYMTNWIQGHNEQFGFKTLVCHDGIFDTTDAYYTTEEVWFTTREFGGSPVENRMIYEKWNPMNHVAEWNTPELVIHSGKDYRLVDGQGIAAFTALQMQGVSSRFLYFPDENHWVLNPANSLKWHHEILRWLDEWVGTKEKSNGEDGLAALVLQQ